MYKHESLDDPARQIRLMRQSEEPQGRRSRRSSALEWTIEAFPLSEVPAYQALSYTWGCPYKPSLEPEPHIHVDWDALSEQITLNGRPFSIRPNLHAFLSEFAASCKPQGAPEYLWCDAICINQEDLTEKNAQVGMMGDIYRTAASTLVWLGPSGETMREAAAFMQKWSERSHDDCELVALRQSLAKILRFRRANIRDCKDITHKQHLSMFLYGDRSTIKLICWILRDALTQSPRFGRLMQDLLQIGRAWNGLARRKNGWARVGRVRHYDKVVMNKIYDLSERSYWTRAWIVQELYLAQHIDIFCGGRNVTIRTLYEWSKIAKAYSIVLGAEDKLALTGRQKKPDVGNLYELILSDQTRSKPVTSNPWEIAEKFSHLGCNFAQDRIYAFNSLLPPELRIPVEYEQPIGLLLLRLISTYPGDRAVRATCKLAKRLGMSLAQMRAFLPAAKRISPGIYNSKAVLRNGSYQVCPMVRCSLGSVTYRVFEATNRFQECHWLKPDWEQLPKPGCKITGLGGTHILVACSDDLDSDDVDYLATHVALTGDAADMQLLSLDDWTGTRFVKERRILTEMEHLTLSSFAERHIPRVNILLTPFQVLAATCFCDEYLCRKYFDKPIRTSGHWNEQDHRLPLAD